MDEPFSLFHGPHVRDTRFALALNANDFETALEACPQGSHEAVEALASAKSRGRYSLSRLVAAERACATADPRVEAARQRLIGAQLDEAEPPKSLDGQPAAAFLYRGGQEQAAKHSLERHLSAQPADVAGWTLGLRFFPRRAAGHFAFHADTFPPAADDLIDLMESDDLDPSPRWVLPYAWLARWVGTHDLALALRAAGMSRPLPLVGDGRAFAWYIVEAQEIADSGLALSGDAVEARRRLRLIHPPAFSRYLARAG